jgi:pantoate--beta-alanine ligase
VSSRIVSTAREMHDVPAGAGRRAVVMTMGALHDGHAALIRRGRELVGPNGTVVVTVFVNPTQFGAGEDFERYPRSQQEDLAICDAAGADVVFVPGVVDVYGNPTGFAEGAVTIDPGPLGDVLEGAARPGHFRGVLTVVAKLLALTSPDVALFGEKDYQQLVLIRRMARDLSMPIDVVGVPTEREPDGLALSSRNGYLSPAQRVTASMLPRALSACLAAASEGAEAVTSAGLATLAGVDDLELDYLTVTDPELGPAPARGDARVLVAARVGQTRLIDNRQVRLGA